MSETSHAIAPIPPSPGYETTRMHVRAVFWFIAGFIATLAALLALLWWYEWQLQSPPAPPSAPELSQPLQPSLNHRTLPWEDLVALQRAQEARLRDGDPAQHQLPIDRAIDGLLKSGELSRPWKNPQTFPYTRPATEPHIPPVENRT